MPRRRRRQPQTEPTADRARTDEVILTLIMQTQQINDRLTRLEERVEAGLADSLSQADADDLMELRLHSARLAAELSRVTIELRAEIDELAQRQASAPAPHQPDGDDDHADVALDVTDEPIIDLTERRARRATGWRRIDGDDEDD